MLQGKTGDNSGDAGMGAGSGELAGKPSIELVLGDLRQRLLDLSGRHRLVNFKHTRSSSLQFVQTSMDGSFRRLTGEAGAAITIATLPESDREDRLVQAGRIDQPEPADLATQVGVDPSYDLLQRPAGAVSSASSGSHARTLLDADALASHCRQLERQARLTIEETGANTLYLVFGFLDYPEGPGSDKTYLAPLVCVPVCLTHTESGPTSSFLLKHTGEEIADNLSLRERIKRDFGLDLPRFDAEAGFSLETYLDAVGEAIAARPNWRLRRLMTLTQLSFTDTLLFKDLDPDNWPLAEGQSSLLAHPLVTQLVAGRASIGDTRDADDHAVDEQAMANLPLVHGADSSQQRALIDVLAGKNLVIESPPGTGKAQTITNLIAAALQAGKKVLFVAEKHAALQAVTSLLAAAGLGPFVLAMHGNRTSTRQVLDELGTRLNLRLPHAAELPHLLERQAQKRRELAAHAELMNSKVGNQLGLTVHQLMWRAELERIRCGASAVAVQQLHYPAAPTTTPIQLQGLCDSLRDFAGQLDKTGGNGPSNPLCGFIPVEFKPEDDLPVQQMLAHFAGRFEAFSDALSSLADLLGGIDLNLNETGARQLMSMLSDIAPADSEKLAYWLLPRLFSQSDPDGTQALATLSDLTEKAKAIADAQVLVQRHLKRSKPASDERVLSAKATLLALKSRGIAGLTQTELAELRDRFGLALDAAVSALKDLAGVSMPLPVDVAAKGDIMRKLVVVQEAAAAAPREYLPLRHPGLRGATVVATLEQAGERLRQIEQARQLCSASFHMDALPDDDDLVAAIVTLRRGDGGFRILQKPWRQAVNLHKRLERQETRKSALQRQHELEHLRQFLEDQAAWNSDVDLRVAAGPHFQADKTSIDGLLALARWINQTDAALAAVNLPTSLLDGTTIDKDQLDQLVDLAPTLHAAVTALDRFDSVCTSQFAKALPSVLKELCDADWQRRVAAGRSALTAMSNADVLLTRYAKPGNTAELGLRAIVTSKLGSELTRQLADHADGKAIFGDMFFGRYTDVESALTIHGYGQLIKQAGLAPSVEQVLMSPDCVANHGLLLACVHGIELGWQAVQDFSTAISIFGQFDPVAWADPSGKSTLEYANGLASKTRSAAEHTGSLSAWANYVATRADLVNAGLVGFVVRLESGAVSPDKLQQTFLYRFYASAVQAVLDHTPTLRQFSGRRHSSLRNEIAELDANIIKQRGLQIARDCRSFARPPDGNYGMRVGDKTEMELLRHLFPQQQTRVPLRQMFSRAGKAIQELKPCFMMAPQAVAQYLSPGHLTFDIVLIDEASQLRPEQVIGAIARGSQLVVLGDPRQLPPTSDLARMTGSDGDVDAAADVDVDRAGEGDEAGPVAFAAQENILAICINHFQPVRQLRWHYRSRHESLIAFSNHQVYAGKLAVCPSPYPRSKALGLRFHYVADGVYDKRINQVEARRLVDAAVDHIQSCPDDSLGIVTLNAEQRDLIADLLDERMRLLPDAAQFTARWHAAGAGLFVKTIDNVQGDERDCIFISTTFGKPAGAQTVRQDFGPIGREDGRRWLNVLSTRAGKAATIFTSLRPEDIVVDGKTPEGSRALRGYLEFARSGVLPVEQATGLPPDSDFELFMIELLKGRGLDVVPRLGVAGFCIDIAVKHPTHPSAYLAAIECDAMSTGSGASVLDRDHIRRQVLDDMGWRGRIWRIVSAQWYANPILESEQLLRFLEVLRNQASADNDTEQRVLATMAQPVPQSPQIDLEAQEQANNQVFADENQGLDIEIDDVPSYASVADTEELQPLKLAVGQTDQGGAQVPEPAASSAILSGAAVGVEQVVNRAPARAPQLYVIQGVKRAGERSVQ